VIIRVQDRSVAALARSCHSSHSPAIVSAGEPSLAVKYQGYLPSGGTHSGAVSQLLIGITTGQQGNNANRWNHPYRSTLWRSKSSRNRLGSPSASSTRAIAISQNRSLPPSNNASCRTGLTPVRLPDRRYVAGALALLRLLIAAAPRFPNLVQDSREFRGACELCAPARFCRISSLTVRISYWRPRRDKRY
jgi:hypothetical protein